MYVKVESLDGVWDCYPGVTQITYCSPKPGDKVRSEVHLSRANGLGPLTFDRYSFAWIYVVSESARACTVDKISGWKRPKGEAEAADE